MVNGTYPNTMQCYIIGVVDHIPTINTLIAPGNGKAPLITGGILVDYQTYVNAYAQDLKKSKTLAGQPTPPVFNQICLHTHDAPVSLPHLLTPPYNSHFRLHHL